MTKPLIVLLSRQRSGTNALRAVLNTHPDLYCYEEVLNPDSHYLQYPWSYFHFIEENCSVQDLRPSNHLNVFASFVDHLHNLHDKPATLIDLKINTCGQISSQWRPLTRVPLFDWIQCQGVPVIRLQRANYLRVTLSNVVAERRGIWHDRPGARVDSPVVEIECEENALIEHLDRMQREDDLVAKCFSDYENILDLEYGKLFPSLNQPIDQEQLERVAEFLNLDDQFELETWCSKSAQRPLWDAISNWSEVVETLTDTPWEPCLQDEPMYRSETEIVIRHEPVKLMTATRLIAKLKKAS